MLSIAYIFAVSLMFDNEAIKDFEPHLYSITATYELVQPELVQAGGVGCTRIQSQHAVHARMHTHTVKLIWKCGQLIGINQFLDHVEVAV